jgi:hypothetical protein
MAQEIQNCPDQVAEVAKRLDDGIRRTAIRLSLLPKDEAPMIWKLTAWIRIISVTQRELRLSPV